MALGFGSALAGAGSEIARGLVVVGYDDTEVISGLTRTEGAVKKTGGVMANLAVGFGLVALASLKMADDFEVSMDKIEALVGTSKEQVEEWKGQILSLAGATGKGPKELADAMFFIASAGFKGASAIDVLTASAKASAAGLGETKVIADAVTSAVNAYGESSLSASRATDILIAAVKSGKLEPAALAGAMGTVIAPAQKLGISFDQVTASVASMSRLGIPVRRAVFGLNAVMTGLIKPTAAARKEFAHFGLSMDDIRKSVRERGLLPTLQDLQAKIGDNVEGLGKAFPNVRALGVVLAMLGKNTAATTEIFKATKESVGATDEAFNIMRQDLGVKLHRVLIQLQVVLIRLGLALMPIVQIVADGLLKVTAAISKAIDVLAPFKVLIEAVVIAFIAWKVAALATVAITAVQATVMGVATVATGGFAVSLFAAQVAAKALWLTLAANPIGLIVTAIAVLVFAFIKLYQHSEKFRDITQKAFQVVGTAVVFYVKLMVLQIKLFLYAIEKLADAASHLPFVGDKFDGVADRIKNAREGLDGLVDTLDNFANRSWEAKIKLSLEASPGGNTFGVTDLTNAGAVEKYKPLDGTGGDGTTKPPSGGRFKTPLSIERAKIDARGTASKADDIRALQAEKDYLLWVLNTKEHTKEEDNDLRSRIADANDSIQSIEDGIASDQKSAADKRTSAREKAAADRKRDAEKAAADRKAKEAREQAALAASLETPQRILLKQALARRDVDEKNDIAADKLELNWIRRRIAKGDLRGKNLTDMWNRYFDARDKLAQDRKARKDRLKKLNAEEQKAQLDLMFLTARAGFFGSFGSNVFQTGVDQATGDVGRSAGSSGATGAKGNVTVVQNFNAPTENRDREARLAFLAHRAQFDG